MKFTLKTAKAEHIYITYNFNKIAEIERMSETEYIDYMLRMIEGGNKDD